MMLSMHLITPTNGMADLLAVGREASGSYEIGVAISSLVSLKSQAPQIFPTCPLVRWR